MSRLTVVYDSCVLYPAPLRDLLIRLARTDLFRACWTEAIHDEWVGNLLRARPDISAAQVDRTRSLMNAAVPDCLVIGYEVRIAGLILPDPNDCHVLAAALEAVAQVIVTFNLRDFPSEYLEPLGIAAQHPDDFLLRVISLNPLAVRETAEAHRLALRKPPKTPDAYLETLRKQGLPKAAAALEKICFKDGV